MSYLGAIAKETGWVMDFILWELPYATGLGLIHGAAIRKGVAMELRERRDEPDMTGSLREGFEAMRESFMAKGEVAES